MSYTKNGVTVVSDVKITDGTYSLSGVEDDNDWYGFALCNVDYFGNIGQKSEKSVKAEGITFELYDLPYIRERDKGKTITAIIANCQEL